MIQTPKPDLTEHEVEAVPFDQVMKKLIEAKPTPKKPEEAKVKPKVSGETHDS